MTSDCYPQGWTNTSTAFYSPGICPSGYTTACITAKTANTVTETLATCCPTSWICASSGNILGCRSTIIGAQSQLITMVETSNFSSISTIHTEIIGGNINAYGVQIRFQVTDLQHATATTSTATTTSSPGATTPPPTSTPTNTSPPSNSTPTNTPSPTTGLSAGAKAGIGVGAALAVCIGLALLWLGLRRAKKRRAPSAHAGELEGTRGRDTQKFGGVNEFSEMPGDGVSEAPGNPLHREVEGYHMAHRHEMEGSRR
ncbi:hypothetical protein MMC22_001306 [Lobaria immixta]|nr:hypothetical protein [Lobaria immixta]